MDKKYVLGVDGGNTKTEYYLSDLQANIVGSFRAGTCSHEKMQGGFKGFKNEISHQLEALFAKSRIDRRHIAYSVFGLAGADFDWQKAELKSALLSLGFENFVVENDGYIALKAGSSDGTGVCSINGTGTVAVGIDKYGKRLQVGGIGALSGDFGGGTFLAQSAAGAVYDQLFRCGRKTVLTDLILGQFNIDKDSYGERMTKILKSDDNCLKINLILNKAEQIKDTVALKILSDSGKSLGKTTAGCISNLSFENSVNIVLAGSIWVKGEYKSMLYTFKKTVEQSFDNRLAINFSILKQPPAVGAAIWALEQVGALSENQREKLLNSV